MKKMKRLIVFICIQICYASSVFAQYQWLDENNQMQFSDRPPPREIPESNIIKRPKYDSIQQSSRKKSSVNTLAEKELEFRKRQIESADKAKNDDEEKKRQAELKASCEQQRNNLSALENGQRMSKFSANGERIFLEDNERDEAIAKIRNEIQQYCK